jgi:hypothetical protein
MRMSWFQRSLTSALLDFCGPGRGRLTGTKPSNSATFNMIAMQQLIMAMYGET